MLPVQPMPDDAIQVKFVKNGIGIALLAGGKNNNLVKLTHFFEETESIGPDRYIASNPFLNFYLNVRLLRILYRTVY